MSNQVALDQSKQVISEDGGATVERGGQKEAKRTKKGAREWTESANVLSSWTYWWLTSFLILGYRRPIEEVNMGPLEGYNLCGKVSRSFDRAFDEVTADGKTLNLWKVLLKTVGWYYAKAIACMVIWAALSLISPAYLLRELVTFVGTPKAAQDTTKGYILIAAFFANTVLTAVVLHRIYYFSIRAGLRCKTAIMVAVFNKALRLRSVSSTIGEIVTIQSNDAYRVMETVRWFPFLPATMMIVLAVLVLVSLIVGPVPGVVGVVLLIVLFVPIQTLLGKAVTSFRAKVAAVTDVRIRLMSEIITAIKLVKLYNWEKSFADQVAAVRDQEMVNIRKGSILRFQNASVSVFVPMTVTFITFLIYYFYNGRFLSSTDAYTVAALFEGTRYSLVMVPYTVKSISEARVAMRRITRFLSQEELVDTRDVDSSPQPGVVKIEDGSFLWNRVAQVSLKDLKRKPVKLLDAPLEDSKLTLKNIDIHIKANELVAIVGRVGSGKSSLLSAVLGQIMNVQGKVSVRGRVAYVSQQPWILNESLRSNILFGEPFDEDKYTKVLHVCQLVADLSQLPAGDLTEIGERGINLSGGQKQRVALARAVYSDRDIYILDDPLSAVDQHVGNRIFHDCFASYLAKKTRLLVLNQLQYLPKVDRIIVLHDGEIQTKGTYADLVRKNVDFGIPKTTDESTETLDDKAKNEDKKKQKQKKHKSSKAKSKKIPVRPMEEGEDEAAIDDFVKDITLSPNAMVDSIASPNDEGDADTNEDDDLKDRKVVPLQDTSNNNNMSSVSSSSITKIDFESFNKSAAGNIISKEDRSTGSVGAAIYLSYARASGTIVFAILLTMFIVVAQASRVIPDIWLTWWLGNTFGETHEFYLMVDGILIAGCILLFALRNVALSYWSVASANALHNGVFARVLKAPMSFFDSTPVGRILNRFTKDQDNIDDQLPDTLSQVLHYGAIIIGSMVVIAVYLPWVLVALGPLLVLFVGVSMFYRKSAREMKRIEGVSRSPIFAHLSSVLTGLPVIRAYGVSNRFIQENFDRIDRNNRTTYYYEMAARFLAIRLDFIVALIITVTALLLVFTPVPEAVAGVALMYAMQMASQLQWFVRVSIDCENSFTSVERLLHYAKGIPSEAPDVVHENRPAVDWPPHGVIEFDKVEVKYKEGLEPVLQDLSFKTEPAEKIGIVGRTGAGKSTLITTIFRILELNKGAIRIDGVDISKIGLHDLRSNLGIIPQEPVLFTGTVRSNLDPFSEKADHEVWEALEKVDLKAAILKLDGKLSAVVVENGENFSVGQRQLLCIARALLRHSKILVLDEATASIDLRTDEFIQRTIRKSFRDCTVLTIAHRLHTIIDSDRVLVLEKGRLIEIGTPTELLEQGDKKGGKVSEFARLVDETGNAEAKKLRKLAAKHSKGQDGKGKKKDQPVALDDVK